MTRAIEPAAGVSPLAPDRSESSPVWAAGSSRVASARAAKPVRLFLHIGVHKTGTTSLQLRFFHNAEQLKRDGFLYPLGRFAQHPTQHSAICTLVAPEKREEL